MSIYSPDLNDPFVVSLQKFMKETDFEIPSDATLNMSGELNPFYGLTHTDEVRERLSKVDKSYTQTEEYRLNMSKSLKKRNADNPRSKEWCDNLSKALTGYKKSKEHVENHRKSLIEGGKVAGENNPRYGVEVSQETREKMSKSMKGKMVGENNPMYGKSAVKGKKWYNNGQVSGRFPEGEQPEGYIKGRLQ